MIARRLFFIFIFICIALLGLFFLNRYFNWIPIKSFFWNQAQYSKYFIKDESELLSKSNTPVAVNENPRWYLIEKELENLRQDLLIREKLLDAREKSINELEKMHKSNFLKLQEKESEIFFLKKKMKEKERKKYDRKKNVEDIATKIMNIEPEKAVKILNTLDEKLLIEIFHHMDSIAQKNEVLSITSYLISLMDTKKIEKMIRLKTASFWDYKFLNDQNQSKQEQEEK